MKVDWRALLVVAATTIGGAVSIVAIASLGILLSGMGHRSHNRLMTAAGYALFAVVGLAGLGALWLMIPLFHPK